MLDRFCPLGKLTLSMLKQAPAAVIRYRDSHASMQLRVNKLNSSRLKKRFGAYVLV